MPSWRGGQLKHRDNFSFTFTQSKRRWRSELSLKKKNEALEERQNILCVVILADEMNCTRKVWPRGLYENDAVYAKASIDFLTCGKMIKAQFLSSFDM
jgi:hypothetical protein